jgi:hypothetical protein
MFCRTTSPQSRILMTLAQLSESILESSTGRMPHLPPLRYGRMMQSPLTTASMPTLSGVASHFPETAARFFERLMGDVPPEFAIRDLQQPPVAYQKSRDEIAARRHVEETGW